MLVLHVLHLFFFFFLAQRTDCASAEWRSLASSVVPMYVHTGGFCKSCVPEPGSGPSQGIPIILIKIADRSIALATGN